MKPFRNAGWEYYDQVRDILPDVGARGSHAFSALNAASVSADSFEETSSAEFTDDKSKFSEVSRKRKLSSYLTVDGTMRKVVNRSVPGSAGSRFTPSPVASSETYSSRPDEATSAIAIHNFQGSINQLNESLCRFTDKYQPRGPDRHETMKQAVELVQESGLTYDEMIYVVKRFTCNFDEAIVYLSFKPELRAEWVKELLRR
jgi:hypothetical protein